MITVVGRRGREKRARLLEMIATRRQHKNAHLAGAEIQRYFMALLRHREAVE